MPFSLASYALSCTSVSQIRTVHGAKPRSAICVPTAGGSLGSLSSVLPQNTQFLISDSRVAYSQLSAPTLNPPPAAPTGPGCGPALFATNVQLVNIERVSRPALIPPPQSSA